MVAEEVGRGIIVKLDVSFLAEDDRLFGDDRSRMVDSHTWLDRGEGDGLALTQIILVKPIGELFLRNAAVGEESGLTEHFDHLELLVGHGLCL